MIDVKEVLSFISRHDFVSTEQLCTQFSISESTACRILKKLSSEGTITRVRGGAIPHLGIPQMMAFEQRIVENREQKIAISRAAASLVHEHDTIILMGGTTVCEMCPFIQNMNLTVITNSILVLNGLRHNTNIRLVMLGGIYNPQEEEIGGLIINQNLSRMRATHMFMGSAGFDERFGFAVSDTSIDMYMSCIESSLSLCVLTDSTKYMRGGMSVVASPDQVDYLITDNRLSARAANALREQNVNVIIAD